MNEKTKTVNNGKVPEKSSELTSEGKLKEQGTLPLQAREAELPPPPPMPKMIEQMMAMSSPVFPPYMDKIGPEHITKIIDSGNQAAEREFRDRAYKRRYYGAYTLAGIAILVFFTFTIGKDNPNLYYEILKVLVSLGIGFAGGYGIGTRRRS